MEPPKIDSPYYENLHNVDKSLQSQIIRIKDTSEIRTLLQGPTVSLFQRFHCSLVCLALSYLAVEFLLLSSVPAGITAALAGKIYWIYKAMEERRKVKSNGLTRRFLEGTQVKEEVEKRMKTRDACCM